MSINSCSLSLCFAAFFLLELLLPADSGFMVDERPGVVNADRLANESSNDALVFFGVCSFKADDAFRFIFSTGFFCLIDIYFLTLDFESSSEEELSDEDEDDDSCLTDLVSNLMERFVVIVVSSSSDELLSLEDDDVCSRLICATGIFTSSELLLSDDESTEGSRLSSFFVRRSSRADFVPSVSLKLLLSLLLSDSGSFLILIYIVFFFNKYK